MSAAHSTTGTTSAPTSQLARTTLSPDTPESEYSQPLWNLYHKAWKVYAARDKAAQPLSDDDVQQIFALYAQTGFTAPPRTWGDLLADVYDSNNHSFTDHAKAHALRVAGAHAPKGIAFASALSRNYIQPAPGAKFDVRRGLYWLARLASYDVLSGAREKSIALINSNPSLSDLAHHATELSAAISYDLGDSKELNTRAGLFLARAHNSGLYGRTLDQNKAHAYYHAVATRDVDWSPQFHPDGLKSAKREAALACAIRALLGIHRSVSPQAAIIYAQHLTHACNDNTAHVTERGAAQRITHLAQLIDQYDQRSNMLSTLSIIEAIIERRLSPDQLLEDIKSGKTPCSDLLEGALSLIENYLRYECVDYPLYSRAITQIQARLLGQTEIHPVENQFRYNAVDAMGSPILGAINQATDQSKRDGFGRFRGLSITENGAINFAFEQPGAVTGNNPLIIPEDIEVAMALAFGEKQPIWPTFSAEPPSKKTPISPSWKPFRAEWTPQWLGHTALGNTLFATDCEAGSLLLRDIELTRLPTTTNPSLIRLKAVIDQMAGTASYSYGHSEYLTFRVAAVELAWSASDPRYARCDVKNVVIGLHTGIVDENGNTIRTNNKDFTNGYRAALFNANYDLFAEHYPLLERYRQLVALVTALNQLRDLGFKPQPQVQAAAERTLQDYVRRPAPIQSTKLYL